jgi:hypothetical protein
MKWLLSRNTCWHAPANSMEQFISAYTAGGDGFFIPVQETADNVIVVAAAQELDAITGEAGELRGRAFSDLRKLNFGARFQDSYGTPIRYTARLHSLARVLHELPEDCYRIISIPPQFGESSREQSVGRLLAQLRASKMSNRILVYTELRTDLQLLKELRCELAVVIGRSLLSELPGILGELRVAAVEARTEEIFGDVALTPLGVQMDRWHRERQVDLGVILDAGPEGPTIGQIERARELDFVWGMTSDSMHGRPGFELRPLIDERFAGTEVNTELWALGYARVGTSTHVYQENGIHVDIQPFIEPPMSEPAGSVEAKISHLEDLVQLALRRTATYTGGGVGLTQSLDEEFSVEVDVSSRIATQATTVEIAITNVNPGPHITPWNADGSPRLPQNDHEKHVFFDPHGAAPFVGSEHDENDGFRINSHLGSEYADNNYGTDVGDGTMLEATLRLERRGPYVSAYYRPMGNNGSRDWICTGVVRNDSLNPRVYLRCAGKRWQKMDPQNPGQHLPVVANSFLFSRVLVSEGYRS